MEELSRTPLNQNSSMKIAVVSDTHLHRPEPWLDSLFVKYFSQADYLLHCGDFTSFTVWQTFCQHPGFHAVLGNCDDWQLTSELSSTEVVKIKNFDLKIGMVHGWGNRSGVAQRAAEHFGANYDLVCYGHTHIRNWDIVSGVQVVNPGSLYNPRDNNGPGFAMIEVTPDGDFECEFVDIR